MAENTRKTDGDNYDAPANITLREYFERILKDHEKFDDERFRSTTKAIDLAAEVMNLRLASMNEFREQMKDQAASFITRAEYNYLLNEAQILKEDKANKEGTASRTQLFIAYGIAIFSVVISLASFVAHILLTK